MSVKAFFFDAHGVLYYRPSGNLYFQSFLNSIGFKGDIRPAQENTALLADLSMCGKVDLKDYRISFLQACGFSDPAIIEQGLVALQKDQANVALYEGVTETLETLKAKNYKLGIITDSAVTKVCKLNWLRSCGLRIVWDAYANSVDLGTRKPDPLMYHTALRQARITPLDSVFVGHAPHELLGARLLGFTTVAFNPDPGADADFFLENFSDLLSLPLFQHS